jgi:hypothetical protein
MVAQYQTRKKPLPTANTRGAARSAICVTVHAGRLPNRLSTLACQQFGLRIATSKTGTLGERNDSTNENALPISCGWLAGRQY